MRWKINPFSAVEAAELARELGLYSIVAGVLVSRNMSSASEVHSFINPSLANDWSDPRAIENLESIAKRLQKAVMDQKTICIFGDYDVDGITASAIMSTTLQMLGSKPKVVLPLREGEGYGLTEPALERIFAFKPDVLLTVDCGVSSAAEAKLLQERGIEVLITDHHESSGLIPEGVLLADPKLDPTSQQALLAGAGVALKLAALLGALFDKPDYWKSLIDLAALGTIADCMPLLKENRSLVFEGVKLIEALPRPGIAAVNDISGRASTPVSSEGLSFGLIPRLNAAGRVSDPLIAFDLLCCDDPEKAMQLASRLEALNIERKQLEQSLFNTATQQIGVFEPSRRSIVVGGEHWHDGVKGIVASRLMREYGVPVIVFSFEDDLAVGSGRTAGEIDLHAAVGQLSDMLLKFGGHQAALGLTIEKSRFDEFAKRFEEIMQSIPSEQFMTKDTIDCIVGFEQLSLESVDELAILAPFGKDNPEPRFMSTEVLIKSARFVGSDNRHIAFVASDGVRELQAIWFNTPYRALEELPLRADIVYRVQIDEWRGRRQIKLHIDEVLAEGSNELFSVSDEEVPTRTLLENLLFKGKSGEHELHDTIACALCGSTVKLHGAQKKCLETLGQKQSTLAIMATGRGKSLIFQTQAVQLALSEQAPSLFIYPLRSLISDQEYFLSGALDVMGLTCASLTGATPRHERERIVERVKEGSLSIVLTTPEFVLANAKTYDFWNAFRFVVIDEAHHIATSGEDFRPDYTRLEQLASLIPQAVFLGLSATSDEATTNAIVQSLGIKQIIIDTSKRPNLTLVDKRNTPSRADEVLAIAQQSAKSLIYASSRAETIELCKTLRKQMRDRAHRIAFYHGALTPKDRQEVERNFRNGELDCLIATSAFGEGVNIPDVRDVVLYDLPYSIIDFNQMAGRAGRDGQEAFIHILAQSSDIQWMAAKAGDEEQSAPADERETNEISQDEEALAHNHLEMFADWFFKASPLELSSIIQKPLTPLKEQV